MQTVLFVDNPIKNIPKGTNSINTAGYPTSVTHIDKGEDGQKPLNGFSFLSQQKCPHTCVSLKEKEG